MIEIKLADATEVKVTDDRLVVELEDGRSISLPLTWYPRLLHGTPEERNRKRQICFRDEAMSETNNENLEERFEAGQSVLDYFDTDVVLTIDRLAQLAPILNLSAVAWEAGSTYKCCRQRYVAELR